MDRNKCVYFIQLLILLEGLVLIDGQLGYGRARIFRPIGHRRRRIFTQYPDGFGTGMVRGPYPHGPMGIGPHIDPHGSMVRDPLIDPHVDPHIAGPVPIPIVGGGVPTVGVVDGLHGARPTVVDDRSGRSDTNVNVVNENNNVHENHGSNNVQVSQVSGNNVGQCPEPCPSGMCSDPMMICQFNRDCPQNLGCSYA